MTGLPLISVLCRVSDLSEGSLVAQPELISYKCDEFRIGGFTLAGINGIAEESVEGIDVSAVPRYLYCVTDSSFHS